MTDSKWQLVLHPISIPVPCPVHVLAQRYTQNVQTVSLSVDLVSLSCDPAELLELSLSFGVEVFEPGHHTPVHVHPGAHELFFVLAGRGECRSQSSR